MSDTQLTNEQIDKLCGLHVMEWNFKPGVEGRWYEYDNLVATEDWSPSTDISDAWQIVREIKERKLGPEHNHPDFGVTDEGAPGHPFHWAYFAIWVTGKHGGTDEIERFESYSISPARAICFAALRLVGALPKSEGRVTD